VNSDGPIDTIEHTECMAGRVFHIAACPGQSTIIRSIEKFTHVYIRMSPSR